MVGAPQVQARLGASIVRKDSKILAAGVEALTGPRLKRVKRSELALSVDGDGIHIYNVMAEIVNADSSFNGY